MISQVKPAKYQAGNNFLFFKTNQSGLAAGRYPAVSAINKSNRGSRQARLDNRRGLLGRFWLTL